MKIAFTMYCRSVFVLMAMYFSTTMAKMPDWLITPITTATTLTIYKGNLVLTNGLISRMFSIKPDFATVDYFSHEKQSSLLRATGPEAVVMIDSLYYNIGGLNTSMPRAYMNRTYLDQDATYDFNAFHFMSYSTAKPEAPFPYTPKRGAPQNIVWPPKGLRLDVKFVAPFWAPEYTQHITVTVHYEMYDGIPAMSKWVTISGDPTVLGKSVVGVPCVEYLAVNNEWGNADWSVDNQHSYKGSGWLHVETDQSHGTVVNWSVDPAASRMPGSFEPQVNVTYQFYPDIPLLEDGFESFRVHELLMGTSDPERQTLCRHRMFRMLAPHTQENPIFFHMTNSSTEAFRAVIDQLAEVGFEMLIYSFGSGFNIESENDTYIQTIGEDIKYANSKGIEVGGYDLISLSRHVKEEWMAIGASHKSIGSACFASGWYDYLSDRVFSFINKTGLSMVETDGPYGGYQCTSTNHSHHKNDEDSVYYQQKLQGKFFHLLREKGIYINQPDYYFYQGGSKSGMGYSEEQYSLPRWQDISISRQSVYDDTYHLIPTAGWMFVPLVQYHGGGAPAVFEPLAEHPVEYEWALAQYLGAGVAACYRGYRVYDTNITKALVTKWVSFYKTYRDILISDIIHVRRPDMQSIDSFMHVNPGLKHRGLAMVFNPTDWPITTNLTLPLYYTGLTTVATVSEQGGLSKTYQLERDYSIEVPVKLDVKGITWFLIQ